MIDKYAIQKRHREAIIDDSLWFYSLYGHLFPEWEKPPTRAEPAYSTNGGNPCCEIVLGTHEMCRLRIPFELEEETERHAY